MSNKKSRRNSILIAASIALAMTVWMLSGLGDGPSTPAARGAAQNASVGGENSERQMNVMVRRSTAQTATRELVVSGRSEPNRGVELKAETDGAVVRLGAERGSRVADGETIVELDIRDRRAQLNEAEALIVQMQLQYDAAEGLRDQQLVSEAQIAETKARLVGAQATRERILLDIARTTVTAPFDGIVNERTVEIGDYVSAGDTVANVVDTDPMIIVGEVNEREVGALVVGNAGAATLVDGTEVEGTIRYLAPVADSNTRTYAIELAVPNPDGKLRAGMTAEMRLGAGEITAHTLTPALLALADDGTIGVKAVDEFDAVRFHPVTIIASSVEGVSVTGLPNSVRIITVGQGFVTEGQTVAPAEEPVTLSESRDEYPH